MNESKVQVITNLFENKEIRSLWDSEKEEYYFSVIDVISVLSESKDPSDYWTTLKRRLIKEEKSELPTNCRKLKMKSSDGKYYKTDTLDMQGIFRLIESVPSPKAESFKNWLAHLNNQITDKVTIQKIILMIFNLNLVYDNCRITYEEDLTEFLITY